MSMNFSYLNALQVSGETTAEFTFHGIMVNGKSPVLIVAPATEANKPYFNAIIQKSGKSALAVKRGGVNAGMVDDSREEDRTMYPKHIIRGWRDMIDGDTGTDAKFSETHVKEFLAELPGWLFDDLRNFCGNPSNFTDAASIDVETLAKN